ncbi:Conserved oligomeric Golgi complex component, putative [Perkinsus marinus ATCC 50983]|uniref:Conserved oligomeric Golgi complex subunit 8 n=1 Tax=Perkinsus marinus (strain ATCC 50983 / TXsc) TaxID=423536 RepID=C5LAL7_PERM5|nr:Conserved oligomeric Golgi complex component, putative [Perkinsus marinus ATCC 50983]EER06473.1 Conserved oligomeric Golgi complex component, putative [Perkinsus marinus ATCC 50983]|eukprot:XP_002774657.1 Conserved oligomeric Golgi complex component, putative [Perkinsus marinus ATCC 50983]
MADSSEGEGSSSGMERWPGVDLEDVNELTREYRRKTQANTDPYMALLYPDKDPSEYSSLPLAACVMDYLPTICANYTVERVNAEASGIEVDIARTKDEMESLAVNNYKAFITAAKVLRRVDKDVLQAREDLQTFGKGLDPVEESLSSLRGRKSKELSAKKAALRQVMNHSGVHELLELPALIDATIRNKLYREALELLSFADKTLQSLTTAVTADDVPSILITLRQQVDAQRSHLLSSLISQLGSPQLQLPQAVLPTVLPNGGSSTQQVEMIIRVAFLTQRCQYVDQQKESIDAQTNSAKGDALLNTLRAASDLLRAYVFDTAMQYRSLFNSPEVQVDPLAVWMSSQVSWFVSLISSFVTVPVDASEQIPFGALQLAALYRYCSHASSALSRVGCAFMPLIEPLLDAYLQQYICKVCLEQIAMEDFNLEMQKSLSTCLSEVARSLRDLKGTIASTDEPELHRMTRHFVDIVVPVVADMYSKIYGDVAQSYLPLISTEVLSGIEKARIEPPEGVNDCGKEPKNDAVDDPPPQSGVVTDTP